MKVLDANITEEVADLLNTLLSKINVFELANKRLTEMFNIKDFFYDQEEYLFFKAAISESSKIALELNRSEYGDFQTNQTLAQSITLWLYKKKKICPKFVVEPTCGKGNFIIAALSVFDQLQKVVGVEIYKPYTWETKFNIINFYISNPHINKPEIEIFHANAFNFDFNLLASEIKDEILILGNPPWVTNSKLSTLQSNNLPQKSNFKKFNGIDAITGKGNFDIGEYITLMMFDAFQNNKGHIAFLVKNSVIKNIISDQYSKKYKITDWEKLTIDSKKEFNVSVDASLLQCKLNSPPSFTCKEYIFYNPKTAIREFGWVNDKFVSNTFTYLSCKEIDGICPFEWRQGIKHDLSSIMELEKINGHYINGQNEEISLEKDLIFGLLKSSDLKKQVINSSRKFTIVTQRRVGQETFSIKEKFPKTYQYLQSHKSSFSQRKSSIYTNKPDFSIFGIGDYSFTKFKVAISGLYKTYSFSLILPSENKPLMLDDTCYLLGFDILEYAAYTSILLNSEKTKKFLQSITFIDAKRTFTKDVLMRINLYELAIQFNQSTLQEQINLLNLSNNLEITLNKWHDFLNSLKPKFYPEQMNIFSSSTESVINF
jgi:hypothetical protein